MRACLAICIVFHLSTISPSAYSKNSCRPVKIIANHTITHVYDGDTVKLHDGRKVRLIGINTPELYPKKEPGAHQAVLELAQLLDAYEFKVHLQLGKRKQDRYGRWLAHLFLADGTNVSAWMLRRGLGYWITVGKNESYLACYHSAEQFARRTQRNLWRNPDKVFQNASELNSKSKGFYLIQGQLVRVLETNKSVWLELKSGMRLRLDKRNYGNFSGKYYVKNIGETLMTRGWVYTSRGRVMMNISHPSLIEFDTNN